MPVCFVCSNTNMLNFQPVKERMGRMRKRKRNFKLKRRGGQIHCAPLVFAQGIYHELLPPPDNYKIINL